MTLVSILGDFHSSILPIFFEFKDKLTYHIILHDDSKYDKNQASKLIQAQRDFIELYKDDKNIDFELVDITINEDDYEDILKAYDMIKNKASNPKDIYLNATDGLNSVSLVLSNKILKNNGKVIIYDRFANTYNIHTKNKMKKKTINNNMDIKNHLRLKGYKIVSYTNKFTLKNRKDIILELTNNLVEFKQFANTYKPTNKLKGKYGKLLKKTQQTNEPFVKGGVFEEYIYWLIKDNLDVDDIMTGVFIDFDKEILNEIDILFIKNNHLHTIECKFTDNFKTTQYLYKTDSIMDYIDDDGKAMILTIGDKAIGLQDKARAEYNNINIYAKKVSKFKKLEFLKFVKDFFELKLRITN